MTEESQARENTYLRDHLAISRTALANERTFLAYVRTALALFIVGVTFVHFAGSARLQILGVAFSLLGGITLVIGIVRFKSIRQEIRTFQSRIDSSCHVKQADTGIPQDAGANYSPRKL